MYTQGHDCGHRSFSNDNTLNDVIGHLTHGSILVPFHGNNFVARKSGFHSLNLTDLICRMQSLWDFGLQVGGSATELTMAIMVTWKKMRVGTQAPKRSTRSSTGSSSSSALSFLLLSLPINSTSSADHRARKARISIPHAICSNPTRGIWSCKVLPLASGWSLCSLG